MTAHTDALRLLRRWIPPTRQQGELREQYVDHLERHADGLLRRCRPDHLTASTLVLSPGHDRVLLTLHAKAGRWFQFGGHVEDADPTLPAAALREAGEESGLTELQLDPQPVHLDLHEVPFCGGDGARHLDVRFLAVAAPDQDHAVSEESREVRWWPVAALPSDEPSLRELVEAALARLDGPQRNRLGDGALRP